MKKSTATLVLSALAFAATTACAAEPVLGLITKTESNAFFVKMKEGAEAEAKKLGALHAVVVKPAGVMHLDLLAGLGNGPGAQNGVFVLES